MPQGDLHDDPDPNIETLSRLPSIESTSGINKELKKEGKKILHEKSVSFSNMIDF